MLLFIHICEAVLTVQTDRLAVEEGKVLEELYEN